MFLDPAHRAVPLGLALANLPACEGILNVLHHLFIFAPRDHKPLSFCQKQAAGDKAYKACGSGDGEGGHVRQKLPQGQPAKPPCFFFLSFSPLFGASIHARHLVNSDPCKALLFRGYQSPLHSQAGRKRTFALPFRRERVSVSLTDSSHPWRLCFSVK